MFQQILVPLDGSRFSSSALKYAIDLAKHYGAGVVLLRAVEPTTPVPVGATTMGMESPVSAQITVEEALKQDQRNVKLARRYMSKKLREVTSRGIKATYYVVTGEPFESIMKYCKKERIDLVVMTTHGKSGIKRAILGSVADQVVRDSRVPVLAIRPRQRRRS